MNRKLKYFFMLIATGILALGNTAYAGPYSNAVTTDQYNNNTPNGIPTPSYTPGLEFDLFNAVNRLYGLNGSNALKKNEELDRYLLCYSSLWNLAKGYGSLYVIGASARNTERLGVYSLYNGVPVKSDSLVDAPPMLGWYGDGTEGNPYPGKDFYSPGTLFGWYIDSTDWRPSHVTTNFYSDPLFNPDRFDHMVSYRLNGMAGKSIWIQSKDGEKFEHRFTANAYLIGFEDRLFRAYNTPTCGDDDYNDLLVLVDGTVMQPAPEPTTMVLVSAGLAGLWLVTRRQRK